ncbi:MAG: ABC transporter permease [Acidobacteriales bacterium 13_2_20CM_2_55_5]|jgi:putative ABC transport system permease protein|nr:MAG: ABC transporter permease [Acidobacteriales bacterium 13_2_20CM_2_55_5]
MAVGEILAFAYENFCSNKVRFALTALGMVIGTASLILVVTIGMTGKQYVLNQIQAIGANLIYAEYVSGGERITNVTADPLTLADMEAAQEDVPGIIAASPVIPLGERIPIGGGKERDIQILGVYPEYRIVRNLVVLSGRFFDAQDEQAHNKVGVITQKMAEALYGSQEQAIGKVIKLSGLPFTIIGTFRERVDTFGQSEVIDNTMVIPYTVSRYFTDTPTVRQIYFSVADPSMVGPATAQIKRVIQSRHRPESVYNVENLTQLVAVAEKTANALTVVLLLVAAITLLVSGIGIMNIMLATVSARIREIGIRKAIGATNREIRFQFLSEAILISLIGGFVGVIIGLALPFSVRFLTEYRIPISGLSAIVAIVVSSLVGVLFGTVPATRAAKLDPVESLRYE